MTKAAQRDGDDSSTREVPSAEGGPIRLGLLGVAWPFLLLAPAIAISDRVTSTEPSYEKRWLLHAAGGPQIRNGIFNSEHERGRALFRTLLPQRARITKIGGPGKRFWVDGRDYPLPEGARYGKEPLDPAGPLLGQRRVGVRPTAARKKAVFLHLIQTGDPGRFTTMTRHEPAGDAARPGAAFETADGRRVVVRFNANGPAGGHIRIGRPGVRLDRPLTRQVQKQAGFTGRKETRR